jgi:glyoxylase-like metal-dependent hydrolase (beta-lactamase superfamily II)
VNSYFIPGPEPTLIDVPPDERGAKEYLETALGDLGCRIEDITRILVTHPHLDHYGAAAWVVERSGAKVWISREAAGYLERPVEEMEKDFRYYCRFMEWAGTPEKGEYYLRDFFEAAKRFGPGVEVAGYLEEGDRIKCGSSSLTVISVPGHTPWCTLFYDAQRRLGFTGDFLIKDISSNATVHKSPRSHERYKSLKTYISSLRKVRALGIGAAFPGHGDRIDDVEGRIDEVLALISDRKRLIRAILKEGPSTPYGIMSRIFPKLPNFHVMLGISEVVGHLEILEEEGEVKRDKGSSVYRPAQGRG